MLHFLFFSFANIFLITLFIAYKAHNRLCIDTASPLAKTLRNYPNPETNLSLGVISGGLGIID